MYKHMLKFQIFKHIILCLVLFSSSALAEKTIIEDLIINSSHLKLNKNTLEGIFSGNVTLWFNNGIIIKTDKMIIKLKLENNKRKVQEITIPHKLQAIKIDENNKTVVIIADQAIYLFDNEELRLTGNINMQEKENFVKCNELIYLTNLKNIQTKEQ